MNLSLRVFQIELQRQYSTELLGNPSADIRTDAPYLYETGTQFGDHDLYVLYSNALPNIVPEGQFVLFCVGQKVPYIWRKSTHSILLIHSTDSLLTVFNRIQEIFLRYHRWNEALYAELSHDSSFSVKRFVEIGLSLLKRPFYVMDSSLRIVFSSTDHLAADGTTVFCVSDQTFPQGYPCSKNLSKSADMERNIRTPYFSQQIWNGCRLYCYNIYAMEHFACCSFFIENPHAPFDDKDLFLANTFFNLFRKVYLKNLQNADNYAMRGQALYHILTNHSLSSEEYSQLSLNENEAWSLFRLEKSQEARTLQAEIMVSMLNLAMPPHILATVYNGKIIGMIRSQTNDLRIEQQISAYFQDLLKEMGYIAAISNEMTDLLHADVYYQQITFLCENCVDTSSATLIYHFNDYIMDYILKVCTDIIPEASLFTSDIKRLQLYEGKKKIDLLKTLNRYLDNECNVTLTAQELYLHRTSLVKRLARIEQLLNHSLDDPNYRLYLRICLRCLKM